MSRVRQTGPTAAAEHGGGEMPPAGEVQDAPHSDHWAQAPTATIGIAARRDDVFRVIADPATYPDWLPGAQHIRSIDRTFPAPGSAFRHVVGFGPLRVADRTEVLAIDPPHRLDLRARIGPLGAADVRFELVEVERADGTAETRVDVTERPQEGVLAAAWKTLARVHVRLGLWGRNELAVHRLKQWCEGAPRSG